MGEQDLSVSNVLIYRATYRQQDCWKNLAEALDGKSNRRQMDIRTAKKGRQATSDAHPLTSTQAKIPALRFDSSLAVTNRYVKEGDLP